MHMLLLVGVSVAFALSTLTSNNFYSEKVFTSSANQWVCNELRNGKDAGKCPNLIAQAPYSQRDLGGIQSYYGSGNSRSRGLVGTVERFFSGISRIFRTLF
jgi:hypothetical protein